MEEEEDLPEAGAVSQEEEGVSQEEEGDSQAEEVPEDSSLNQEIRTQETD